MQSRFPESPSSGQLNYCHNEKQERTLPGKELGDLSLMAGSASDSSCKTPN